MIVYMFPDGEKWPVMRMPHEDGREDGVHVPVDVPDEILLRFHNAEKEFDEANELMLALYYEAKKRG